MCSFSLHPIPLIAAIVPILLLLSSSTDGNPVKLQQSTLSKLLQLPRQPWDRKSFEDDSYDATTEEVDYTDWDEGKWAQAGLPLLCTGEKEDQQICRCEYTGDRADLLCAAQGLATTNVQLPPKFMPSVAHMEHNSIKYLIKDKILPGRESELLSLDLSSNQIADMQPGVFDKFAKLQVLVLTHNKLDSQEISADVFTPEFGNSLHQLFLDYNFITKLDEGVFDNLTELRKLVLDGNRGLKISKKIFTPALAKLEVLSLDKCDITELEENVFANLVSLRALSLSGNPLDKIPLALAPLHSLTHLAMSSTNLKELNEGMLQNTVPRIEKLYMRKMKYLWKIGGNAFKDLDHLRSLDFAFSSRLRELSPAIFGAADPPRNISELNLQHCNLSTLSAEIMSPIFWKSMDAIKLNGNPFVCDCKLKWLLDMKDVMRTVYKSDEPKCKYPPALEGHSLYDANKLNDLCDPHPSSTGKFVVFLVFVVLVSSLVAVGLVYARRRYVAKYGGDMMPIPRIFGGGSGDAGSQQMGYSAGGTIFEDDEEEGSEAETDGEAHHPHPSPPTTTGYPQPEFV